MRKRVRFSIAGLVLVLAAGGLAVWGGTIWVDLCRCEVQLDSAWTRLDNGYRHRMNLTRDLLALARPGDGAGADPGRRLRETLSGLSRFATLPVLPDNQDRTGTYLAWQHRLGDVLNEYSAAVRGGGNREVDRLCDSLDQLNQEIVDDLERFRLTLGEYDGVSSRFPGSLVARVARMKQSGCPTVAAGPVLAR